MCTWSRQHSYASTTASSHAGVEVDEVPISGPGSDEHPAFALLSGDEHPSAYALMDENGTWEADLVNCAIDVLQRAMTAAGDMKLKDHEWRGILDFELFPLCEQSTAVSNAISAILPLDWCQGDFDVKREDLPRLLESLEQQH